jgi:hypothetical protein
MRDNNRFHYRQANTATFTFSLAGGVNAIETVKQSR